MAQASVLTAADIRRVFRIIETTRYADRNRLTFVLSIYGGMRVGEIAAVKIKDVANQLPPVARAQTPGFTASKQSHDTRDQSIRVEYTGLRRRRFDHDAKV